MKGARSSSVATVSAVVVSKHGTRLNAPASRRSVLHTASAGSRCVAKATLSACRPGVNSRSISSRTLRI